MLVGKWCAVKLLRPSPAMSIILQPPEKPRPAKPRPISSGRRPVLAAPVKAQSGQPQTYIVVTATSLPSAGQVAQAPNQLVIPAGSSVSKSQPQYPVAVAPTVAPPAASQSQQAPPSLAEIAQDANSA